MEKSGDKQHKEGAFPGLIAIFLILVIAFSDLPNYYTGIALITVYLVNFLWSISKKENRENKSYKESLKTLLYVIFIVLIISLIRIIVGISY
ncbi:MULTISPECIES: hypothetical protein [Halobacillus]|uniref:hypothetical protein n=1 Tax=Halobacillus TaxID=45667 RepID=UPI00136A56D4|nr:MULTISPECIES: hypothetical protein [Halobacillus]MYL31481.1 hypothetical protein [Halobacillus halophilus]MYL39213.1 hypothetical protein [Halobacillus litoralis]